MSEKQTMIEWLERHNACTADIEWAKAKCNSLKDVWSKAKLDWLLWVATRPGVLTKRDRVRLGAGCAERVRHLMKDPRSTNTLDVCARFVRGEATYRELAKAATDAAAAEVAAWRAVAALRAFADGTAAWRAAAAAAAAANASSAAAAAAAAANAYFASDASYAAERKWQAAFLRREFTPNFGSEK